MTVLLIVGLTAIFVCLIGVGLQVAGDVLLYWVGSGG